MEEEMFSLNKNKIWILVKGCPGGSGWPPGPSVGDPRLSPLFIAAASFSVQSLALLLLTVSSFSIFGVFWTLWFPPDSVSPPLLSSLCSGVLCFSVVHRSSLSPLIEKKRERERDRERGLPVISVTVEAFSEGITPDHLLAYLRCLDVALLLLGNPPRSSLDFLPPVSPRGVLVLRKLLLISKNRKLVLVTVTYSHIRQILSLAIKFGKEPKGVTEEIDVAELVEEVFEADKIFTGSRGDSMNY
ncbi:hypothetical protein M9H77_29760 [Catharanthus roseus]|uniref:Uncharacterized protein n=1 Tax=Catharanthus roseus TaxID=4058 RepID=A0ACB9ZVB5_CATRO|nr:hypothetical protein M9H77_29760 [Catharanthus roseus]